MSNYSEDLLENLSATRFEFNRNNIRLDPDEEYFLVTPRTYTQLSQMAIQYPLTIQYNYDERCFYLFGMFKIVCIDNAPRELNTLELITQQFPRPVGNLYATPQELKEYKENKEKIKIEKIKKEQDENLTAIKTLKL